MDEFSDLEDQWPGLVIDGWTYKCFTVFICSCDEWKRLVVNWMKNGLKKENSRNLEFYCRACTRLTDLQPDRPDKLETKKNMS